MKSKENKLSVYSPYLDHYAQSEYAAVFEGGHFRDDITGLPILLNEGTPVRIIVANVYIPEKDALQHIEVKENLVFNPGEEFIFNMPLNGQDILFNVKNKENIYVVKKGNKKAYFINTSCQVTTWQDSKGKYLPGFTPIDASSFNEAFRRVSEKFRQGQAAHTCNIYKSFYHKSGTVLGMYRDAAF